MSAIISRSTSALLRVTHWPVLTQMLGSLSSRGIQEHMTICLNSRSKFKFSRCIYFTIGTKAQRRPLDPRNQTSILSTDFVFSFSDAGLGLIPRKGRLPLSKRFFSVIFKCYSYKNIIHRGNSQEIQCCYCETETLHQPLSPIETIAFILGFYFCFC